MHASRRTQRWHTLWLIGAYLMLTMGILAAFATQQSFIDRLDREQARSDAQACMVRKEGRDTLRNVLFGIISQVPPSAEVTALREYIDSNYPPVEC